MVTTLTLFMHPLYCTNQLQPLDLNFNKPVKDFMRGKFQELYSNQVLQYYEDGSSAGMKPIQFPISQMKYVQTP